MSQFYDQASLVMIPSGYKEGKVYSQKPLTADGQLTFSRSSNATRVDSNGLIEKVHTNELLQSNTFSNAAWSRVGNALTGGQAGYDASSDAWLVTATGGGAHYALQSKADTGIFTLSVYAKQGTSKGIRIAINGGGDHWANFNLDLGTQIGTAASVVDTEITSVGDGWYRISVTANKTGSGWGAIYILDNSFNPSYTASGETILIQNAQLESGLVATPYIETTTAAVSVGPVANLPRLSYDPANPTCPSLLLEGQRTNLATRSELFTDSYWGSISSSITANAAISPEGVQNAFNMPATSGLGSGLIRIFNISSSTQYVCTIYAKSNGATSFKMRIFDGSTGQSTTETKTATSEWQRFDITRTSGASTSQIRFDLYDNDGDLLIYGAQFEAGAYATSYIPSYGAATTRGADSCSKTGISSLIGVNQGSIYVELDANGINNGVANYIFDLSDGTNFDQNRISMYWTSANDLNIFYGYGGTYASGVYTSNYLTTKKVAVRWTSTQLQVVIDGVAQTALTYGNSSPTKLSVGIRYNDVEPLASNVKQCLLFNNTLTTAQLQELTAL